MRGRLPTPTAIKLLRGNPGHRALPVGEPVVEAVPTIEPPANLTDEARAVWRELAPALIESKLLTLADCNLFGVLCEAQAELNRLTGLVAEHDAVQDFSSTARAIRRAKNSAAALVVQTSREFGLSPSSRTRVNVHVNGPASRASAAAAIRERLRA